MLKRSDFQDLLAPEPQDDGDPRGDIEAASDPKEFGLSADGGRGTDVELDITTDSTATGKTGTEKTKKLTREAISPTPFVLRHPAEIQPREWLYGNHYIRKFVTATIAPGGMGKSSLALAEAVAMCTG